jgi:hypothetical protein
MPPKTTKKSLKQTRGAGSRPGKNTRARRAAAAALAESGLAGPAAAPADPGAAWFALSSFAAFYWFTWLLVLTGSWPVSSNANYKIFSATLFVVLPLALLSTALYRRLQRSLFGGNENTLPALLCAQSLFWVLVWMQPAESLVSPGLQRMILWSQPLVALLAVVVAGASGITRLGAWTRLRDLSLAALPALGLVLLWHFRANVDVDSGTLAQFILAAGVLTALLALGRGRAAAGLNWVDWAAFAAIAAATFSVSPEYDAFHQNCYLGPVNEVFAGRSMLSDVLCEYGVAVIYFVAAAFKVLGLKPYHTQFTFLLMTLTVGEYLLLYWLTRRIFRSRLLALACLGCIICFCRYGSFWQWDNFTFPSVGPLRFGLPILILASGYLGRARRSRFWAAAELGLLGLASIWSLETLVYSLSAWGFAAGAEILGEAAGIGEFLGRCRLKAAQAGIAVSIAYAALTLLTLMRSGGLLHWGGYLDWLRVYTGTAENYPLSLWTPWILLPGVCCLSLLASSLAVSRRKELDAGLYCMVGVAGAAAAEFSYFIIRSHPNNLGHVAPLYIVLLFYWIDQSWARPHWSGAAKWTATPVAFFVLAALLWNAQAAISLRWGQSLLVWLKSDCQAILQGQGLPLPASLAQLWAPAGTASTDAALRLMKLYAPDQPSIAVFTADPVEVYALSGRADPFPIAYADEERWIRPHIEAILKAPLPLKAGDVMLVGRDAQDGYSGPPVLGDKSGDLISLLNVVKQQFKLEPLEYDKAGVWAVRLAPLDAAPAPKS